MPSLVENGKMILEKKILNFHTVLSIFRYHLPLLICMAFHFSTYDFSSPMDDLCHVWLKSGEEDENAKVYRQTNGQTVNWTIGDLNG